MKNKLLLTILIVLLVILIIVAFLFLNGKFANNKNDNENQNSNSTTSPSPIDNVSNEMTEQDKSIFNSNFDIYAGTDIKGSQVKTLISIIKDSNKNTTIGKVDITINGESTTDYSKIKTSSTYTVNFEYNEKDLINKAIIQEN